MPRKIDELIVQWGLARILPTLNRIDLEERTAVIAALVAAHVVQGMPEYEQDVALEVVAAMAKRVRELRH